MATDEVTSPKHYTAGKIEVIDFITAWNMDFLQGNVIKYVTRFRLKVDPVQDLLKAKQYLEWMIERELAMSGAVEDGLKDISTQQLYEELRRIDQHESKV